MGDEIVLVKKNRALALSHLGLGDLPLIIPKLEHGKNVVVIDKQRENLNFPANTGADAIISDADNIVLGVTFADCIPILLSDNRGQFIGALHAGWRGLQNGVIRQCIQTIEKNYRPSIILAAIGPHISVTNFEVRDRALDYFSHSWPCSIEKRLNKFFVNLESIACRQLLACGVEKIEKVGGYTDLDEENYFSFRRDQRKTGRHIAIICKRPIES